MDRNRATYEAFDGVRLELLNGAVAQCEPLTVQEAVRYMRQLQGFVDGRSGALDDLVSEFPARIGVTDARLVDLGLVVTDPRGRLLEFGGMVYSEGAELAAVIAEACWHASDAVRASAQAAVLERVPAAFGVADLGPAEVFEVGREFARELYLLIYGLAQDFCDHLTASPAVTVMSLWAVAAGSPTKGWTT
jgi:hypothetical protein